MKFIVFTPSFSDTSGGTIALHLLCHRLNERGYTALLWHDIKVRPHPLRQFRRAIGLSGYDLFRHERHFNRGPFANPLARSRDVPGSIVIYPEVVSGNPLRARHVVRWLLHKPGFHTGEVRYGPDDLFVYFMDAFADPDLMGSDAGKLTISWTNPVYRDEGRSDRRGSCYLVRKGQGRALTHDLADSIPIDDLSHEEKNEVFNRTRFFYSYDLHTRYFYYAAVCGCIPIVIPQDGVSPEEWTPSVRDRYGIAYGEDQIDWAVATRPQLLERLAEDEAVEDRMLDDFIAACERRFGGS